MRGRLVTRGGPRRGRSDASAWVLCPAGGAQQRSTHTRGEARPRTGAGRRRCCAESCCSGGGGLLPAQGRQKVAEAQDVGGACGRDAGGVPHGHHAAGCEQQRRTESTNGEAHQKNHAGKEKSKGTRHTMTDLRKEEYHGVEDEEKNLVVMVVFAGDALAGRKNSPESELADADKKRENSNLLHRGFFKLGAPLILVLV